MLHEEENEKNDPKRESSDSQINDKVEKNEDICTEASSRNAEEIINTELRPKSDIVQSKSDGNSESPKPESKSKSVNEILASDSKKVKRGSVRLRGNSQSKRPLPAIPQKVIQHIVQADDYGRKCILCPCDSWCPSEFEKNICNNCRHLARMHRTLSKTIAKPLFNS